MSSASMSMSKLSSVMDILELLPKVKLSTVLLNICISPHTILVPSSGKTLSGGFDPSALHKPKRFFGAARNTEDAGSLTVLATALVETGSRMDEVIFEEFKGTGNMEVTLDRSLSEKRIFPAIDVNKSGTRREDLLLTEQEQASIFKIRKNMSSLSTADMTEKLLDQMAKTQNNEEFLKTMSKVLLDE